MKRMSARYFLDIPIDEMWEVLTGEFILVFDDGELVTTAFETIFSGYGWDFHRKYRQTPLLMKHHLTKVLSRRRLSVSADLHLLGNCMWSVFDYNRNDPNVNLDELTYMLYDINNRQYNDLVLNIPEYATSIDILDFMEVLDEPEIFELNRTVVATKESTADTHEAIKKILRNPNVLRNNSIAQELRSGLVKEGQVLQCVGPRGSLTDMDSRIYVRPITRGFAEGIRTMYDSMIESRSAAQSSFFSGEMLEQSEYFSRRLQFVAQTVQNLHHADCGATQYLRWKVRDEERENGVTIRPSDLRLLHGKNYLDEATGELKTITPLSTHLLGQVVPLRSPLYCAHPDPVGICSTCFGHLEVAVPDRTNIGQLCSTYMAKQSSQNILSNKHMVASATLDPIRLEKESAKWLRVGADNSSYLLAERLRGKHVSLVIPHKAADSLQDIFEVPEVEYLALRHVIELDDIGFIAVDEKGVSDTHSMFIAVNKRLGSFTYPMLRYIRDRRWMVDEAGDYVIDMAGWDWDETLIVLPQKHFNMSDHADEIANMLESRVDQMRERDKAISPDTMIVDFFDYVNWKLEVNLAPLEVILYSTMVVSAENNDYSLPKPWTTRGFGVQSKTMENRSLSVAMAYQDQLRRIVSPTSYLETNRVDHIFDGILMPNEVFGKNE